MDDSIVILGRQPALGLAELESLYGAEHVTPLGGHVARIGLMPCSVDFARLGGATKLCKVLTVLDTTNWKEIEKFLLQVAPEHSRRMPEGKMHLGLSYLGSGMSTKQLLATGLSIKKATNKATGRTVRLVPNQTAELSTAQVIHNKLASDNGWELVFVPSGQQIIVAQTVFVQDIDSYTVRDRVRPKRDARVGMLPPKLAQIIINLAVGPKEFTEISPELSGDICLQPEDNAKMRAARSQYRVLDPFCGTGVVLQEALLMGYQAYGTDVIARMVDYTRANLEWLQDRYKLPGAHYDLNIGDATSYQWQSPISVVASETYLGRPFTSQPSAEVLAQTASDCNLIIKKFLQNIHPQLAPGTRLCLAIPAWLTSQSGPHATRLDEAQVTTPRFAKSRGGVFGSAEKRPMAARYVWRLPLIDHLGEIGYNRISFEHAGNDQLLYYREDQIVARQLLVLTRN